MFGNKTGSPAAVGTTETVEVDTETEQVGDTESGQTEADKSIAGQTETGYTEAGLTETETSREQVRPIED